MLAKITFYNRSASEGACSDFSLNCFWGDEYKNVFYLCGDFGRPAFNDIIEVSTDASGQDKRIQNTSIERYNLTAVVSSPLLSVLKTIDKHDVKELLLEDTGDTFIITNVDIEDTGDTLTPSNKVTITFEDETNKGVPVTVRVIVNPINQHFETNKTKVVLSIYNDAHRKWNNTKEIENEKGTDFVNYLNKLSTFLYDTTLKFNNDKTINDVAKELITLINKILKKF